MDNKLFIPIEYSRGQGIPCIWEQGGATRSDNGEAVLVAGAYGQAKRAFVIKDRYNGKHALIPVAPCDHVIRVSRVKNDFCVMVGRIDGFDPSEPPKAICSVLAVYNGACWEGSYPRRLENAVHLAKAKSRDVLCSRPYYVQNVAPKQTSEIVCSNLYKVDQMGYTISKGADSCEK